MIYAASNPSLAALEVLVHYSVLPQDFVLTEIRIPDGISIEVVSDEQLPPDWDAELPEPTTVQATDSQMFGVTWISQKRSAVLNVPSTIIGLACRSERNFVLNPEHPDFSRIEFRPSVPFRFDPRLK